MKKLFVCMGVVLALAALAGCGSSDGGGAADGGDGGLLLSDCGVPLSEYCASDCPTYDESVETVSGTCDGSQYAYAAVGTCDAYRFTAQNRGMGGPVLYFDEAGTLFAVMENTDYQAFCDHKSNFQTYGPVPDCAKKVTEKLCAPPGDVEGGSR